MTTRPAPRRAFFAQVAAAYVFAACGGILWLEDYWRFLPWMDNPQTGMQEWGRQMVWSAMVLAPVGWLVMMAVIAVQYGRRVVWILPGAPAAFAAPILFLQLFYSCATRGLCL